MKIFLAILISILSYVATIGIALKGALDLILIFPKKGYIFNPDKLDEHKNQVHNVKVPAKNAVLLLLPVINMVYCSYLMHRVENIIFNEFKNNYPNYLVPMTDEEIEEYKKRKDSFEKLDYFMKLCDELKKSDIIDVEEFEIIHDDEETKEITYDNPVLDKYRQLRNEVSDFNSINQELNDTQNQSLSRKF